MQKHLMDYLCSTLLILVSLTSFSQYSFIEPQHQTSNFPELNELSTSEIGNSLVTSLEEDVYNNGFHLSKTISWQSLGGTFTMYPSDLYPYATISKAMFYLCVGNCIKSPTGTANGSIFVLNNGKKVRYGVFDIEGDTAAMLTRNGISVPERKLPAQVIGTLFKTINVIQEDIDQSIQVKIPSDETFKQEFIYGGRTASTIKFTYREFVNNLARPSFSQDVQYDLEESNIVGFKGLKIEVVNASNLEIKYKVLSHLSRQ